MGGVVQCGTPRHGHADEAALAVAADFGFQCLGQLVGEEGLPHLLAALFRQFLDPVGVGRVAAQGGDDHMVVTFAGKFRQVRAVQPMLVGVAPIGATQCVDDGAGRAGVRRGQPHQGNPAAHRRGVGIDLPDGISVDAHPVLEAFDFLWVHVDLCFRHAFAPVGEHGIVELWVN